MSLFGRKSETPSLEESVNSRLPSSLAVDAEGAYVTRGLVSEIVEDNNSYLVLFNTNVFAVSFSEDMERMLEIALLRRAKENNKTVTIRGELYEWTKIVFTSQTPSAMVLTLPR